ncbi:MAG: ogt, partial [Reyranella sp.]|nr:ogt [Reyranella sp.]
MAELLDFKVDRLATPVGELLIVADNEGNLRTIDWTDHEARMRLLLDRYYGKERYTLGPARNPGGLTKAMRAYFKGDIAIIDTLPVETTGTPFQRSIWQALRKIPRGTT